MIFHCYVGFHDRRVLQLVTAWQNIGSHTLEWQGFPSRRWLSIKLLSRSEWWTYNDIYRYTWYIYIYAYTYVYIYIWTYTCTYIYIYPFWGRLSHLLRLRGLGHQEKERPQERLARSGSPRSTFLECWTSNHMYRTQVYVYMDPHDLTCTYMYLQRRVDDVDYVDDRSIVFWVKCW